MNLSPRSNLGHTSQKTKRTRKRLLVATFAIALILLADAISGGAMRSVARTVGAGLYSGVSSAFAAIGGRDAFASRGALMRENEVLRLQLTALQTEIASYRALEGENQILRGMLSVAEGHEGVTAPIVSSVRSSPYGTFSIGAGRSSGITLGSLVLASDGGRGFVIGRISDVGERVSLVTEVFAPSVKTNAQLAGAAIEVNGSGSGNASARVPRDLEVAVGDVVTVPEFGGRPVGMVGGVTEDVARAYQEVFIAIPVSLSSLSYVYVLK